MINKEKYKIAINKEHYNKLIAAYLGWNLIKIAIDDIKLSSKENDEDSIYQYHLKDKHGNIIKVDIGGDSWSWSYGVVMDFSESWNRLMPVVIAINKDQSTARPFIYGSPESTGLVIGPENVVIKTQIWSSNNPGKGKWMKLSKKFSYNEYTELDATFLACVTFIEFYNKIYNK